jgi:tripeptide aminopeptidase
MLVCRMSIFQRALNTLPSRRFRQELLVELLAVPSLYRNEDVMASFLQKQCEADGFRAVIDPKTKNVYAVKGFAENYPCLASHIDTVQRHKKVEIVAHKDGRITGIDIATNRQTGIGADCKTGIFTCLEIARRLPAVKLALFACEEIGMIGAYQSDPKFFKDVGYVVEFDCPSRNLASYTSGGTRLFDNQGNFIRTALTVLDDYGVEFQYHPFTDVKAVVERYRVQCLNLSSGYYNWHCDDEFAFIPDIKNAIEMGERLIKALGCTRYEHLRTDVEPLMEVNRLRVPNYV